MSTNIGRLAYQIIADTQQFEKGVVLTRKELNLTRRVMLDSKSEAEQLALAEEQLAKLYEKGAISLNDYHAQLVKLRSSTEQAKAAQQEWQNEQRMAATIVERNKTEIERYNDEVDQLSMLLEKGHISQQTFNRELERLEANTTQAKDAQRKYAEELNRAEQAQREHNQLMQRGESVIRSVETATEKYERELRELNQLHEAGAIDVSTYRRAVHRLDREQEDLNRTMRAATMEFAQHTPGLRGLSGLLGGMSPLMVGAAAAGAGLATSFYALERAASFAFRQISEQMQEVDELAKQSRFLGLAVNDLQALRLAGQEFAGLEFRQVDVGLQRVVRRLDEAAQGTGEAKQAFKELGLDAKALAELSTGDAMLAIADALSAVEDEGERVRLAFKLLDSEGARLALAFADGSASIDEMKQALRDMGMELTDLEANQIEAANDAIGRLQESIQGLGRTAAVEFSSDIEAASLTLQQFVQDARDADSTLGKIAFALQAIEPVLFAVGPIRKLLEANSGLGDQLERRRELEQKIAEIVGGKNDRPADLREAEEQEKERQRLEDAEKKAEEAITNQLRALEQSMEAMGMTADEAERYRFEMQGASDVQIQWLEIVQKARAEQQAMLDAERKRQELLKQGEAVAAQFATPFEQLEREILELEKLFDLGAIDRGTRDRARDAALKDFEKATEDRQELAKLERPSLAQRGSEEAARIIQGIQDQEAHELKIANKLREKSITMQTKMKKALDKIHRDNRRAPRLARAG